jgi:hypothetical protein
MIWRDSESDAAADASDSELELSGLKTVTAGLRVIAEGPY